MWARVMAWAATRAATGWLLFALVSTITAGWYLYDRRGDRIQELEYDLLLCKGSKKQQEQIKGLAQAITEQAKEQAEDKAREIQNLPDDCYQLDGPSPLNRVYDD